MSDEYEHKAPSFNKVRNNTRAFELGAGLAMASFIITGGMSWFNVPDKALMTGIVVSSLFSVFAIYNFVSGEISKTKDYER